VIVADVALICGAGGTLGSAVTTAFIARGDRVVAADRHGGRDEPAVRREAIDLTRPGDVEALWDRLAADGARPRWLVNAVGGFRAGTVGETEQDDYRFVQDLNLGTVWWSCRAAARRMQDGCAIVNVASRSAVAGGTAAAAYSVAKAGVVRLTEVLAADLKPRRVRVNAVLPSVIDTPANWAAVAPEPLLHAVPADEIASVIAFLCSDASAAITGAAIPAYGWA
jgi:NAD(P)-dependent dehydrogenase (short-subunit alcohol dehydrogenase family)